MEKARRTGDGMGFVIAGLLLIPVAAFFSFSFSYLGAVTYPLALVAFS